MSAPRLPRPHHRHTLPASAWFAFVLSAGISLGAGPRGPTVLDLARRAAGGDGSALSLIEAGLDPLFARKDFWALDSASGAREAARLLGPGAEAMRIGLLDPSGGREPLRLLSLDFGSLLDPSAPERGYVAYAIVQRGTGGEASLSWYHDSGRKLAEQGGAFWHPVAASLLGAGGGSASGRTLAIEESVAAAGPAAGLLILEETVEGWRATARIAPPAGASLAAVGDAGAFFLARREPSKGVLTGASPELFRSLLVYERSGGTFVQQPIAAPIPEPVTAAEALIAAVRRGDTAEARRLCVSPDVLDAMLYFSPQWKGGGRILSADAASVEFVYEEPDRPTLRVRFRFENRAGALLLAEATGRAEKPS